MASWLLVGCDVPQLFHTDAVWRGCWKGAAPLEAGPQRRACFCLKHQLKQEKGNADDSASQLDGQYNGLDHDETGYRVNCLGTKAGQEERRGHRVTVSTMAVLISAYTSTFIKAPAF
ncbi:hypothetical protein MJG53_002750 [Ovis ammon polii x Ovis aries]|uniref:Uncharacterized protein n=1 Tax=Ovis ammon polii x Ovis aries TaxID=2918886 RepID=A0ACB9VEY7_9CETA|nr:hypothetical protein MJG53_002750 [Ovis ammon polii x Ovis aries]